MRSTGSLTGTDSTTDLDVTGLDVTGPDVTGPDGLILGFPNPAGQ